jgi:hypothetical protein
MQSPRDRRLAVLSMILAVTAGLLMGVCAATGADLSTLTLPPLDTPKSTPTAPAKTPTAAIAPTPTVAVTPTAAVTMTAAVAPTETVVPPMVEPSPLPALPPTAADSEHFARGEVKFDKGWVLLDTLYSSYKAARTELEAQNVKVNAAKTRVTEVQRQVNEARNKSNTLSQPIRADLAKQKARQRELQKTIDAPPPAKPVPQPIPPLPARNTGGYGGYGGYSPADQQRYQQAQQERQRIIQENQTAQTKYAQDLATFKQSQADARKEMPTVLAAISTAEDLATKAEADLQAQLAPIQEKQKGVNEVLAGVTKEADAIDARIRTMAAALHDAPEVMLFKRNIVEWDGLFSPLDDLEKYYKETQTEISRLHDQLKAEAEAAGQTFPADWRHPQQDRLDALNAVLTRARAAQAPK